MAPLRTYWSLAVYYGFSLDNRALVAYTQDTPRRKVLVIMKRAALVRRLGWAYAPVSVPGVAAYILAVLCCLIIFRAVDRHSHSASDTLHGIFPFLVCTFLLLDWQGAVRVAQTLHRRGTRQTAGLTDHLIGCQVAQSTFAVFPCRLEFRGVTIGT